MKHIYILFLCTIFVASANSQNGHQATDSISKIAIEKLKVSDWQSDLRFLQQTIHKDYSFLFKKITAAAFDMEIEKLYKAMPALKVHERIAGLARIVSLFKYGHTVFSWRESPLKFHMAPVNFYWFSDGLYVEGVDKKYAEIIGSKLVKVEGMPVMNVLDLIKPLLPVENEQFFKAYGLDFIAMPEALHAQGITQQLKTTVTFTLEKDGKTFEQIIPVVEAFHLPRNYGFITAGTDWISVRDQKSTPYYLKNIDKNYYYEYLPESKTVYVRQSQILNDPKEPIDVFYKKIFEFIDKNDVERLVLDVRLNGGGNNYLNKPIVTGIVESKKINKQGKLFVILGRRTFSACQNLVNELSNYTNAIFVGEPSAENINFYGDNRRVELPKSGIAVFLSFAWWQDKPQWENSDWMAPQLAIDMSFDEYKTNNDPVLNACLNYSDKDLVTDPLARFRDLFMANKLDEIETEAKKMVVDPRYRYFNFETKFNDAGYYLLNGKQPDAALFVFQLNTKLFPKSANAWASYAEGNWNAKKTDKAIEYYNKAIELDPHGVTGENARKMLKQIKSEKGN